MDNGQGGSRLSAHDSKLSAFLYSLYLFVDNGLQTTDYGGYSGITGHGIMEALPIQRVVQSLPIAKS